MTPWQRRLRALIAVFGVAVAVTVYFSLRRGGPQPVAPPALERVDPKAAAEGTGGRIITLREGAIQSEIQYEHVLTYADGRQKFQNVRLDMKNRNGRDVAIAAEEAEVVGPDQSHIEARGNVKVVTTDGMRIETPAAVFDRQSGTVQSNERVEFSKGRLRATAVGGTYEERETVLRLAREVVVRQAGERPTDAPLEITAGSAVFPRIDQSIRFTGGFRLVHGSLVLESPEGTAFLTDDESRVQFLELRGGGRIGGLAETPGSLRGMTADNINLEMREDGRAIARATLAGEAVVEVAAADGASRRLSGKAINLTMAPDGSTVTGVTAPDGVRLDLPAEGGGPTRIITAQSLISAGDDQSGLTAATFAGDARFREDVAARAGQPASSRRMTAKTLALKTTGGFGTIEEATFAGTARYADDRVQAWSGRIRYLMKAEVLEIDGTDESTGLMPRVADEQVTIDARVIRVGLDGRRISAQGDVRSTMKPAPGASAGDQKRPSMLKADQPIHVTGDTLTYDGGAHTALYDGHARLWQGDTAVQGDRISIDDATGNLAATGRAKTSVMLDHRNMQTEKVERVSTIGSAADFVYDEATRKATYTTGARVFGPQGDLRGETIELFLKPSGGALDRVEGHKAITLKVDNRVSTGERLTYTAADERYVLVGAPVRIVAECRETMGRTLTFVKGVDTISVQGDDEMRTQSRGGPECWAPRK